MQYFQAVSTSCYSSRAWSTDHWLVLWQSYRTQEEPNITNIIFTADFPQVTKPTPASAIIILDMEAASAEPKC